MKATYTSETSVDFQRNTRRYIPEDRNFQAENILVNLTTTNCSRKDIRNEVSLEHTAAVKKSDTQDQMISFTGNNGGEN
jgi:hypothetical protein